jgi:hypothetical protein
MTRDLLLTLLQISQGEPGDLPLVRTLIGNGLVEYDNDGEYFLTEKGDHFINKLTEQKCT